MITINKINILFGLVGMALGAATGVLCTKHHYKCMYEKICEENKALWMGYDKDDKNGDYTELTIISNDNIPENLTPEEKRERKKQIRENASQKNSQFTDYQSFYKSQQAENAEERDGQNDREEWTEERMMEWNKKHIDDEPAIIDYDDIALLPPCVEQTNVILYYYDETLVCEGEEEPLTDFEEIMGGCVDNFFSNEEEQIVILNAGLNKVYVVTKEMASYYNPDPE